MSLSPDSSFSAPLLDVLSNTASSSSTPPTTVADSASLHSDTSKHDVITVAVDSEPSMALDSDHQEDQDLDMPDAPVLDGDHEEILPTTGRVRRSRGPPPVYNLAKLVGTDGHGKRRANGDIVSNRRRRTVGATVADQDKSAPTTPARNSTKDSSNTIDALNLKLSPAISNSPRTRRQAKESPRPVRTSRRDDSEPEPSAKVKATNSKTSTAINRKRKQQPSQAEQPPKVSRELQRLQDTKEFSHQDEDPVVYTVWSNGKYVDPKEAKRAAARKKVKVEPQPEPEGERESSEPITNIQKRRVKKYLDKGLYSGQNAPIDIAKGLTAAEKKKLSELPELMPSGRVNKIMPAPMYTGLRTLIAGRDFKLPYHVCNPMPPGQPKPDEWKKMTKSRLSPVSAPRSPCNFD